MSSVSLFINSSRCTHAFDELKLVGMSTVSLHGSFLPRFREQLTFFGGFRTLQLYGSNNPQETRHRFAWQLVATLFHEVPTLEKLVLQCFSDKEGVDIAHDLKEIAPRLAYLRTVGCSVSQLSPGGFNHFANLTSLEMTQAGFTTLPSDLFSGLTLLEYLSLESNSIEEISSDVFDGLSHLTHLELSKAFAAPLDVETQSLLLAPLQSLAHLSLDNCHLKELDGNLFASNTALQSFTADHNAIASLPANLFRGLHNLSTVSFQTNRLTALPPTLFQDNGNLRNVIFWTNRITAMPPGLLSAASRSVLLLELTSNRLQSFSSDVFGSDCTIVELLLADNLLTAVDRSFFQGLELVASIDLSNNSIQHVADDTFKDLIYLSLLRLDGNVISELSPQVFENVPSLVEVELDHNRLTQLPTFAFQPLLASLSVSNNMLTSASRESLKNLTSLGFLNLANNRISSIDADALDTLHRLAYLSFNGNSLTTLPEKLLQHNSQIGFLDVSDNLLQGDYARHLSPVWLSLQSLNLSHNPGLTVDNNINWRQLLIADVSSTSVSLDPTMCAENSTVVMRGMLNATNEDFVNMIQTCLTKVDLLDVSLNDALANLSLIQEALALYEVYLPVAKDDNDGQQLRSSTLQLQQTATECVLRQDFGYRPAPYSLFSHEDLTRLPLLRYFCQCSTGYSLGADGSCYFVWSLGRIAGLACGVLVAAVLMTLLAQRVGRWYWQRRLKYNLQLSQALLDETNEEVLALKKAWEIDYGELTFDKRIDGEVKGAFGEVWSGQWDGIAVAIKVMRQTLLEMDPSLIDEFEREVSFMQRTRHPNIVRFWGAGRTFNGTPFLVEELMSGGSLQSLLHGRQAQPLDWALKLKLAGHVARGMAHIHSLGHVHRDLKSGNVLVTATPTAKVADFGSIRRLLLSSAADSDVSSTSAASGRPSEAGSVNDSLLTQGVGTPLYMSLEALKAEKYTSKTDVWSFGVLLWEIAAQAPPDLLAQESAQRGPSLGLMRQLVSGGARLRQQAHWPQGIRSLIDECVQAEPQLRPEFGEILGALSENESALSAGPTA